TMSDTLGDQNATAPRIASTAANGSAAPHQPRPSARHPTPASAHNSPSYPPSCNNLPPEIAPAPNSEPYATTPISDMTSTTQMPPPETKPVRGALGIPPARAIAAASRC